MFNIPVESKSKKPVTIHPWAKSIKDHYAERIKRAHNSIRNVNYPKPKEKRPCPNQLTFTVIGNRTTREFIYCVNMVQGMHKYRWKKYNTPIIRGCTGVEWNGILRNLKIEYGSLAHCLEGQVAVLCNKKIIGGEKELKEMIESKYAYHLVLNYQKDSINIFANYLKSSGRPCAYMHIAINGQPIGTLIFMLYSDVVPITCENFLRLCKTRKGGYSGTPIHRVVKGGWIQGGGFGLKNTKMDCENFIVPHNKRGVLGMANAGRHVECSTQFYVLLEPNEWLKSKFVAFGQLIDGEETLKKIEEVETYYEAPSANITIYMAGVLNLDCQDIRINKGALEYLDGHVEDLVTLGELFYEILMERLFLEIEFRRIQKMESVGGEDYGEAFKEIVDAEGNLIRKNIIATQRFIRKKDAGKEGKFVETFNRRKEDIEQQFDFNRRNEDTTQQFDFNRRNEDPEQQFDFNRRDENTEQQFDFNRRNEDTEKQLDFNQRNEDNVNQFAVLRADVNQLKFNYKTKYESDKTTAKDQNDENNDFDVDSYEYEQEEYKYAQVTPSSSKTPKEKRPYYIPFTDVPYPGEVDSNFNLKRMLQGDYCLESDLDPKQSKLEKVKEAMEEKINAISGIISSYGGIRSEESFSSETLSSDEEQDILEYLSVNAEKVSFSGKYVKRIAKNYLKANPVEDTGLKESFTDDNLRMMRMAIKDFKSRINKKVSINVQPWSTSTQIKRRQTGFVEPEDISGIRYYQPDTDYEEENAKSETERYESELKKGKDKHRIVSIASGPITETQKIDRKPTGYFPSDVIKRTFQDEQGQEEEEEDEKKATEETLRKVSIDITAIKTLKPHHIDRKQTGYYNREDFWKARDEEQTSQTKKSTVRIAASHAEAVSSSKMTTSHGYLDPTNRQSTTRQSVLVRLLEDVADDDDDEGAPKLKNYKPHEVGKKEIKLAMSDRDINENTLIRKSTRVLRRASAAESSEDLKRVVSTELYEKSVMTMDHANYKLLSGIRGATRSKLRPFMTITQYQKMNDERREEKKRLEDKKTIQKNKLQAQGSVNSLIST